MTTAGSLLINRSFIGLAGTWLFLTTMLFSAPYLLFCGYAGRLADTRPKRSVMMGCKLAEIAITLCGIVALAHADHLAGLMLVLFLMASHSAFFSPSKYGS